MLLFVIAAVIGMVKKQGRAFWRAFALALVIYGAAALLFHINYDGLVTAWLRARFGAPALWIVAVPLWILLGLALPIIVIATGYERQNTRAPEYRDAASQP